MESTGLPGRVQVTEQMQRALAPQFDLVERGEVEVKGKGRLHTWLLLGRKTALVPAVTAAVDQSSTMKCGDF